MTWKKDMKNMKNNTKNIEALYERLKMSTRLGFYSAGE